MRYYWFGRHLDKDLKDISCLLEDSGFYGILLPYVAGLPDQFIRIARAIDIQQKLKYLVAVRPYTISPQYLLAIMKSLDIIQEDRVRINFVSGVITESEKNIGGIIGNINDATHYIDRKKYLCDYIEQFDKIQTNKPYYYISGMSQEIFDVVEKYANANIIAYDHIVYNENPKPTKKLRIVSVFIKKIKDVDDAIDNLRKLGYTDIMFHVEGDEQFSLALEIFNKIKRYTSNSSQVG